MNTTHLRRFAPLRRWFFPVCSAVTLGLGGVFVLDNLDTRQPSPAATTASPQDKDRVLKTANELNTDPGASPPNDSRSEIAVMLDNVPSQSSTTQPIAFTQAGESPREVPHPITPDHERLFALNRVLQQAKQAVDFHDVRRLRTLLTEHAALDPTDPLRQRLGYERIADCLESPGRASHQAALSFWQKETASPVRRLVRRTCLTAR